MNENEEIKRLKAENEKLKNRVDELVAGIKEINNARVIMCDVGAYAISVEQYGERDSVVIHGKTVGDLQRAVEEYFAPFDNSKFLIDAVTQRKVVQMVPTFISNSGGYSMVLDWTRRDIVNRL